MSKRFYTISEQLNDILLLNEEADPTAGLGVAAPIGSKYFRGTAVAGDFTKTGPADTDWTGVSQGIYYNVKDPAYGAAGDGVTDDRAAIQRAIDDASVIGGTVYFPPGTYLCGKDVGKPYSFLLDGVDNVRFLGTGWGGSVLLQDGDAGAGAYNLFRITGGCNSTEFELLTFDQSGLSNVGADQCHLINILEAHIVKVIACQFTGGVANAGAYVHVGGAVGDSCEIIWVSECEMRLPGGPCVWLEGESRVVWVIDSTLVSAVDKVIRLDGTVGAGVTDVKIMGNRVENTSTQYAIHAVTGIERLQVHDCLLLGWLYFEDVTKIQLQACEHYASVAGIGDPILEVVDSTYVQVQGTIGGREAAADDGLVWRLDGCSVCQIQKSTWIQEVAGGIGHAVDTSNLQLQTSMVRATNPGAGAHDAFLIEAAGAPIDNIQITNPNITADAGTWDAGIRVLSNGGNIGVVQVNPGIIDDCDTGVVFDDGGGGAGVFTGFLMVAGGVIEAATAAWSVTVAGVYVRVGSNASTFGANFISGTGDPENNVTARIGSQYLRLDGGGGTSLYVKESGVGNTGWVGK